MIWQKKCNPWNISVIETHWGEALKICHHYAKYQHCFCTIATCDHKTLSFLPQTLNQRAMPSDITTIKKYLTNYYYYWSLIPKYFLQNLKSVKQFHAILGLVHGPLWLFCGPPVVSLHTWAFKNLKQKLRKNDFPFRKAPATDRTTTLRSLTSWANRTSSSPSSSSSKVWSSLVTTTCIGRPDSLTPLADTQKQKFADILITAITLQRWPIDFTNSF